MTFLLLVCIHCIENTLNRFQRFQQDSCSQHQIERYVSYVHQKNGIYVQQRIQKLSGVCRGLDRRTTRSGGHKYKYTGHSGDYLSLRPFFYHFLQGWVIFPLPPPGSTTAAVFSSGYSKVLINNRRVSGSKNCITQLV